MKETRFLNRSNGTLLLVWAVLCAFVLIFIFFPLFCVLITPSFRDFADFFSSSSKIRAFANTALSCVCSTTLSVATGYIFAFATVRGNIPFARFFAAIPILHLMTPPFVGGLSFILLFGRQGFFTKTILGLDISPYGFWGLLFSQVLCFFPIAYLMCAETLKGIGSDLEQAAFAMGASGKRIFLTITLPLSLSGILSSALFIAVSVLSDFGNPMLVAGRFRVIAVEIYTSLTGWLDAPSSAVMGIFLVFPSVILFLLQNRLAKKNAARLATIGNRSAHLPPKRRSIPTQIFLTSFCAVVSIAVLSQFAAICFGAFQKLWGIRTEFTSEHFLTALNYAKELKNTIFFSFLASIFSTSIGLFSALIVLRTNLPLKKAIAVFAQLPAAVPGSLFGLAFSLAANRLHFRSSQVMIVAAITVGFLPFSYRLLSSSISQIRKTLDDGSSSLGAGKMRTFCKILIPLSSGGIFSAFLYDFVRGVGTMSAVIFLVSFSTPLASIKILNLADEGFWGRAAALALILTILTFAILALGKLAFVLLNRLNRKGAELDSFA